MAKHHPENERIKRDYFTYLERARRMSPKSVDHVAAAIAAFEESTGYRDFRKFHRNQAIAFVGRLQSTQSEGTGKLLAKATIHSRLMAMKAFLQWLQGQSGYRSRITYDDAEYFNPSANDERIAKAVREGPIPTLEEIEAVVDAMPSGTVLQRRDRAIVSLAILSGARDNALASLALRHLDLERRTLFQDARTVRTKNAKTFTSAYFPVQSLFREVVEDWIAELNAQGFDLDDPIFPATAVEVGYDGKFEATGLTRTFWQNANAIRRVFKEAFARAGRPYSNPHSFRKTLAIHGEKICHTAEEWRAYSQNFGHSSPMTTFASYGEVTHYRQMEIMSSLGHRSVDQGERPMSEQRVQAILADLGHALRAG